MKVYNLLQSEYLKGYKFIVFNMKDKKLTEQVEFYQYFRAENVVINSRNKTVSIKINFEKQE